MGGHGRIGVYRACTAAFYGSNCKGRLTLETYFKLGMNLSNLVATQFCVLSIYQNPESGMSKYFFVTYAYCNISTKGKSCLDQKCSPVSPKTNRTRLKTDIKVVKDMALGDSRLTERDGRHLGACNLNTCSSIPNIQLQGVGNP